VVQQRKGMGFSPENIDNSKLPDDPQENTLYELSLYVE